MDLVGSNALLLGIVINPLTYIFVLQSLCTMVLIEFLYGSTTDTMMHNATFDMTTAWAVNHYFQTDHPRRKSLMHFSSYALTFNWSNTNVDKVVLGSTWCSSHLFHSSNASIRWSFHPKFTISKYFPITMAISTSPQGLLSNYRLGPVCSIPGFHRAAGICRYVSILHC